MSLSYVSCISPLSHQVKPSWKGVLYVAPMGLGLQPGFGFRRLNNEIFGQRVADIRNKLGVQGHFIGRSTVVVQPKVTSIIFKSRGSRLSASWFTSSQIACNAFTWGTVAVLPFYTLMVLAPNAELTRRAMETTIPYVVLGILYAYLLYISWSPDTLRLMFASKYWLPELPSIAKMFSSQMTVASAWLHLLAVDLFAARQVFHDGIQNKVETRHSVSLCLLFCPIGIVSHVITKLLKKRGSCLH